jgi:hypothetical protein
LCVGDGARGRWNKHPCREENGNIHKLLKNVRAWVGEVGICKGKRVYNVNLSWRSVVKKSENYIYKWGKARDEGVTCKLFIKKAYLVSLTRDLFLTARER